MIGGGLKLGTIRGAVNTPASVSHSFNQPLQKKRYKKLSATVSRDGERRFCMGIVQKSITKEK